MLHIEDFQGVAGEMLVHRLQLLQREPVQRLSRLLRQGDDGPDDVMRLPERQSFADEIVCQVRCKQCRVARGVGAHRSVDRRVLHHGGHEPHRGSRGVGAVKQPLLVFLQIAIVGHWEAFQQRQQRNQIANHSS